MLGLPGETEETMQETIDFACSLGLDYAKTTIATPMPATPMYEQLEKESRIKSRDWDKYNLYEPSNEIYDHPNLDRKTLDRYFNRFYRKFYFRPQYLFQRTIKGLAGGTIFHDIYYMLKTKW
jgi:radical SAM superfamily enzyme YgiQ (UPF0313 family)